MIKTPPLALATLALAASSAPAWAQNKCKGPDGRITYSDAPCATSHKAEEVKVWDSNLGGRARAGAWEFRRSKDDMTGKTACLIISPVTSPDPTKGGDFKFIPAHLVISVSESGSTFGVRTSTDKDTFHNNLNGMGVKLDNLDFVPLDVKGGQHVVGSSQGPKILEALPKARNARLRLRFWPYDTLYDTLPINTSGYAGAAERAKQCAESLSRPAAN